MERGDSLSKDSSWQPKAWPTRLFFLLDTLEGLACLLLFLLLPTDPDTRTSLGYSTTRYILLVAVLTPTLVFGALFLKTWKDRALSEKIAARLLRNEQTVPKIILITGLVGLLLLGWALMYQGHFLTELNRDKILRLVPFPVWGLLFLVQMTVIWFTVSNTTQNWIRRKIKFSQRQLNTGLAGILFLAALLPRVSLTGYALPYQSVWDEVVTYPQSLHMLVEPGLKTYSDVPGYGKVAYGDLVVYLTTIGETLGLLNGFRTQQVDSIDAYVSPPQGVNTIYEAVHASGIPLRMPRLFFALINSLAPVGIYILLSRYFHLDSWSAFGGGLIYATFSRELIYYSSFILPDSLATTCFVFLLIAAWECMEDQDNRLMPWVAMGTLAGLILSITIRSYTVISIPVLGFALARKHERPILKLILLGLSIFLGFALTSPYALLDLPTQLVKITSFAWYHDLSWPHALSSLSFYLQGVFKPGFSSSYVDSVTGSIGFGLLVGVLMVLGFGKLVVRYPRQAIFFGVFTLLHLYSVLPVVQRFTRHILIIYPVICISAGLGLSLLLDGWRNGLEKLNGANSHFRHSKWVDFTKRYHPFLQKAGPVIIFVFFMLVSIGQIRLTYRYISRMNHFQPSQVRAAEYMQTLLQPGDRVGILDILPWVEEDLIAREIPYERIGLAESISNLRDKGITYVAGTDRISSDSTYGSLIGTIWESAFPPEIKLAEFGTTTLKFQGYPSGDLYIFVARLPEK